MFFDAEEKRCTLRLGKVSMVMARAFQARADILITDLFKNFGPRGDFVRIVFYGNNT